MVCELLFGLVLLLALGWMLGDMVHTYQSVRARHEKQR